MVKTPFLPCPILLSQAHHTFLKHTTSTRAHTHTHTSRPFFLRCVCTRLPGRKSFSGMDECLQPIHHPPYPPPSPLFLYQPAVTLTTDGPSFSLPFSTLSSLFSPTSLSCAISFFSHSPVPRSLWLAQLTACTLLGVHARIFHCPTLLLLLLPFTPLFSTCPSSSIYLTPVHHWDQSGTFRAARKKAL